MAAVEALVLDDTTVAALVADRQRRGIDRYDEVHSGRYVINAAPNAQHSYLAGETMFMLRGLLGDDEFVGDTVNVGPSDDFRVTDACVVARAAMGEVWLTDGVCRVAVEVLSPGETAMAKPDHYAHHGVVLYIEVDPAAATVTARDLASWHHSTDDVAARLAATLDFTVA